VQGDDVRHLLALVLPTLSPWSGEQLQIDSTAYANFSGSGVFTELLAERFYCSLWIVSKSRIHEFNILALEPSSPSGTDESQLKLVKFGDLRVQRDKSKLHDGVWKINSNLELNLEILLKARKSGLRNLVEGYV
jgi:hypothetical protein